MHKPSISDLIYKKLYPQPSPNDPKDFKEVSRLLVKELERDKLRFYGTERSWESEYPGYDYTKLSPHRQRLRQWRLHYKFLKAIDQLRLLDSEIDAICTWQFTKHAKKTDERLFLRQITSDEILDTTLDCIPAEYRLDLHRRCEPRVVLDVGHPKYHVYHDCCTLTTPATATLLGEESDDMYSVGHGKYSETDASSGGIVDRHLLGEAAPPTQGEAAGPDPRWEQWMQEAIDRHGLNLETIARALREGHPIYQIPSNPQPSSNAQPVSRLQRPRAHHMLNGLLYSQDLQQTVPPQQTTISRPAPRSSTEPAR